MTKKAGSAKTEHMETNEALLEAEKLLEELIAEDPRLRVARKQASRAGVSEDEISEEAVQIYRQRLRE
jgi:hypothetical protein